MISDKGWCNDGSEAIKPVNNYDYEQAKIMKFNENETEYYNAQMTLILKSIVGHCFLDKFYTCKSTVPHLQNYSYSAESLPFSVFEPHGFSAVDRHQ